MKRFGVFGVAILIKKGGLEFPFFGLGGVGFSRSGFRVWLLGSGILVPLKPVSEIRYQDVEGSMLPREASNQEPGPIL